MRTKTFLILCFFLLTPAFIQTQTFEVPSLPENSRNDSPALGFSDSGILWIAWSSYQDKQFRLAVCACDDNRWSTIEYPDPSKADQLEPKLVFGPNQEIRLIYSAFDRSEWSIHQIKRKGGKWGQPTVLGSGLHPTATTTRGETWIAWEQGKNIRIVALNRDRDADVRVVNTELNPEETHLAYSQPYLTSGPSGEVWLTWTASQSGYQSVLLKRIDEKDSPLLRVDRGSGVNREPRIAVDEKGRVWIVYEALQPDSDLSRHTMRQKGYPVYLMEKGYTVLPPSRVLMVTDGKNWWLPETPADPAPGLVPNIHCSRQGTVWLLSRTFLGFSAPPRNFFPLCEQLDSEGWTNHDTAWQKQRSYKEALPLAEEPDGTVWTAWVRNERKSTGLRAAPCWTLLDAPDTIVIAAMPSDKTVGTPNLIPYQREEIALPEPVSHPRFTTDYRGEELQVYFGDLHQHSEYSTCGRWNGRIDQNQDYSRYVRDLDFMCTIDHAEHLNDFDWRITQLTAEEDYSPGEFVTFTGFEWTSEFDTFDNLYRGHYNAVFRRVGAGDYYFSASDPRYNTPLELWNALKKSAGGAQNVFTFPHHTSRRVAWLTWNYYDPEMVPLIEIAQSRGSYEYEGCYSDQALQNDCTRVHGHFIHDGLKRGLRWGFTASGDHGGCQLAAVFSPSLDRDSIFDGLRARRAYATNGKRMFLDIRVDGHFMGEEFVLEGEGREITIKATGTTPLVQIDLFRNGRILRQWNVGKEDFKQEWVDREPLFQRENYYYIRAFQRDGGQAWSSPIWVINPKVPGEFRFQVGGDELRVICPDQETDFSILMHNETVETVEGRVFLGVPDDWTVKESEGIDVTCPPGSWKHAVFHVTASVSSLPTLCLPQVVARVESPGRTTEASQLFVVGSPSPISREQKAILIDARNEVPHSQYSDYLRKIGRVWSEEHK